MASSFAIDQQMATITTKRQCTTCNIQRGIFKCDGCSEVFCLNHTKDHHQHIVEELNHVEDIRDEVRKILIDEFTKPRMDVNDLHVALNKKIDDWERKSVNEIQKVAEEARHELAKYTTERLSNTKLRLEQLTNELQQARVNNDFIETDLLAWKNKLNQFKEELINPPEVLVREGINKLISNIRVYVLNGEEVFERSSGNVDFNEHEKVVCVKDNADVYTEVRGRYEYSTGKHTVSLKVEELTGWILFGIISKSTPLQIHSYISPSCYGWYNGQEFVYAGGENIGGQGTDVIKNDIIHLVIDCDKRLIQLINERINRTLELQVDLQKCPFPWQLHLNLNLAPTRIRIISSTKS
jgi:hypothetical protein